MLGSITTGENIVGGLEAAYDLNKAKNPAEFLAAGTQLVAHFASISSNPAVAGFTIATNAMAIVATTGKILTDYQNNGRISYSDLIALAGNVAIIAGVTAYTISPLSRAANLAALLARGIGWLGIASTAMGEARAADMSSAYLTAASTRPVPIYRDPLAIDLDGDGIETVGINVNGQVVTFDHNADGVRTGTG